MGAPFFTTRASTRQLPVLPHYSVAPGSFEISMEPELGKQQAEYPVSFPGNGDIAFMQAFLLLFSVLVTVSAQRRLVCLCSSSETQAHIWSTEALSKGAGKRETLRLLPCKFSLHSSRKQVLAE